MPPMNALPSDLAHPRPSAGRSLTALAGWLLLTFSASATAVFVSAGGWYAGLAKPTWNPPGWIFGPVWTILYAMMAVAAWRVWLHGGWPRQKTALRLYLIQWALNALWTPLFFGLHQPGWALADSPIQHLARRMPVYTNILRPRLTIRISNSMVAELIATP